MKQCTFGGCDKPVTARELCKGHYNQWYAARPLTPLDPNRKRMAAEGPCSFDGCTNPMKTKGYCNTHYAQSRKGKKLTPIGEARRQPKKKGYSDTKTCDTCLETKNWRLFIMGTDRDYDECRECYRRRLLPPPVEEKKRDTRQELLAFLEAMLPSSESETECDNTK